VLFVCLGNACRSQMAEAFARVYGSDVLAPASAGLAPGRAIPPDTIRAMDEKNIDLRGHFPKGWWEVALSDFDFAVNMSGYELPPQITLPARSGRRRTPFWRAIRNTAEIRDRIENLVMELILEMRRDRRSSAPDFPAVPASLPSFPYLWPRDCTSLLTGVAEGVPPSPHWR
jgi:arsenate reductase (thioredoxin)